jgi:hypothetical protein
VKAALTLILDGLKPVYEATAAPHVKVRQYASLIPLKCSLHAYLIVVRNVPKI